jgi:Fe-S cluster biosynthesis and repair protein YggX
MKPITDKDLRADQRADRLFAQAKKYVYDGWGKPTKLGADLYSAVLHQEWLVLLSLQDEDISDARVRELIHTGRELIEAEVNSIFYRDR